MLCCVLQCELAQHWSTGEARAQPGPTFLFASWPSIGEITGRTRQRACKLFLLTVRNGGAKQAIPHKSYRKAEPLLGNMIAASSAELERLKVF